MHGQEQQLKYDLYKHWQKDTKFSVQQCPNCRTSKRDPITYGIEQGMLCTHFRFNIYSDAFALTVNLQLCLQFQNSYAAQLKGRRTTPFLPQIISGSYKKNKETYLHVSEKFIAASCAFFLKPFPCLSQLSRPSAVCFLLTFSSCAQTLPEVLLTEPGLWEWAGSQHWPEISSSNWISRRGGAITRTQR